jgi:ribulose bisphosphate carboxylase small subunit
MTPPIWPHRRIWPDHRANDRVVLRDGSVVARIYQHEHGPQIGHWAWFGQWAGYDNSGVVATLDEALNAVRDEYGRIGVVA